ncbi:MAG: hypothetical protein N3G80_01935 [Candidatus Micrarchaeota archaeon]|nr:hypothetical protein [Candidatus Micrarchaeota archaeon]
MKINIGELTYEEMREVAERLRNLKIEISIRRVGTCLILQTENGPVQLHQDEAAETFSLPEML